MKEKKGVEKGGTFARNEIEFIKPNIWAAQLNNICISVVVGFFFLSSRLVFLCVRACVCLLNMKHNFGGTLFSNTLGLFQQQQQHEQIKQPKERYTHNVRRTGKHKKEFDIKGKSKRIFLAVHFFFALVGLQKQKASGLRRMSVFDHYRIFQLN